MTSKEDFNHLRDLFYTEYLDENFDDVGVWNNIEKDLQVLDQLKEILSMDYLVRVYGYDMAKRLQTYLKSNDIVKEWLENDK